MTKEHLSGYDPQHSFVEAVHAEKVVDKHELFNTLGPSLLRAFDFILSTDTFFDGEDYEFVDDESRGIEIGNLYDYALEEGLSEEEIDHIYEKAKIENDN